MDGLSTLSTRSDTENWRQKNEGQKDERGKPLIAWITRKRRDAEPTKANQWDERGEGRLKRESGESVNQRIRELAGLSYWIQDPPPICRLLNSK